MDIAKKLGFEDCERSLYHGAIILNTDLSKSTEWKSAYDFLDEAATVFGIDPFCNLFVEKDGRCFFLNIETGEYELICEEPSQFYQSLEDDKGYLAAESLYTAWLAENGPVPDGCRLMPAVPFFLGGEYEVSNIKPAPVDQIFNLFADIHRQTKDLPEGSIIDIKFT